MISTRWWIWGGLALLGAAAVALAPPADTDGRSALVAAVPRPGPAGLRATASPATGARPGALAAPTVLRLLPRQADTDEPASRLWQSGRPPVAPVALPAAVAALPPLPLPPPPPPPSAPPPPYRLIGRYADNARNGVILQGPDGQIVVAHAGQLLGEQYRIESLAGNTMVLTYLPLNLPQTMDIGIPR